MASGDVLLVEDDRDIRETLAEVLEDMGYAVTSAEHGADALHRLREPGASLPAVILLDLMMPVMDGLQFRNEQRRDPRLAAIPVIVITAGSRVDAAAIDARAILRKPLELPQLISAIEQCRSR